MGATTLVTVVLFVLAAAGGAFAAQRLRAKSRHPGVAELARGKVCLFCLSPVPVDGRFATLTESKARESLGAAPPEGASFTGPQGEKQFLTHIECLRDAQEEVCMFCLRGILPGEEMAFIERPYARDVLGEEPVERAAGVDPGGKPCFFGHADCTREATKALCMFCLTEMKAGDISIGFEKPRARELLGAEPSPRSETTEPGGNGCHVAHAECARAAGADIG
ncbi:hypothetical protein [Actinomadura sp. NEAU-AAG7]|uniref:hypothetical protein n=1 Tax=Actinomadura sp. NEAU-AAG7 TaxID=2839640 RepID=UPI001BE48234|nr:hypothetical protein [Actinomadura sp. NEAU-AAG7]MBT2207351.1 hypothetical protein [Actinomadura sp. NEAU-AAG7]